MYREEESPGSIRTEDSFNSPSVAVIGKSTNSFFMCLIWLTILSFEREEASSTTRIQSRVHLRAVQLFLNNTTYTIRK